MLIPTLPDLSRTPRGLALDAAARTALAFGIGQYNTGLLSAFGQFAQQTGASVIGFRLDNLFLDILNSPAGYGFNDTTRPCIPAAGYSVAPSRESSVFFDDLHPTTAAHAVVGRAAAQVLQATVPEPATVALVGAGLVAVGAATARRRRAPPLGRWVAHRGQRSRSSASRGRFSLASRRSAASYSPRAPSRCPCASRIAPRRQCAPACDGSPGFGWYAR